MLHFVNPDLSVLEIGSQRGDAAPVSLLKGLSNMESFLDTASWTVACQTGDAMTKTQEQLSSFGEAVKHATLDVCQGLDNQELKDEKFDLVLAFNLAGTAEHPVAAFRNTRKLLKDGGEACFVEINKPGSYFQLLDVTPKSRYV